MANSLSTCCEAIHQLMRSNRRARGTLTGEFFREIVDRQRIEANFLEQLDIYAKENFKFGIVKLDRSRYLVFRTSDKFFREDPYKPEDEDDD